LLDTVHDEASRRPKKPVRQKTDFPSPFNPIPPVQSSPEKYSTFVFSEIGVPCPCPVLDQEGRFAIVTSVERGMRWTQSELQRAIRGRTNNIDADGQAVWSWHPDADAKLLERATRALG
jgi:hypothetical protein